MGMNYEFIAHAGTFQRSAPPSVLTAPPALLEMIPESVARENGVFPLTLEGEVFTLAAIHGDDILLADKLSFIVNKRVRLVTMPRETVLHAIDQAYRRTEIEAVDSMLMAAPAPTLADHAPATRSRRKITTRLDSMPKHASVLSESPRLPTNGIDPTRPLRRSTMFFYVVEEGQRALVVDAEGHMEIVVGPKRLVRWGKSIRLMQHYVAHPGDFLIVRFRDGRQEHLVGPAEVWFDPRVHLQITRQDALQIAAKEAVVVYSRNDAGTVNRRLIHGPTLFVPAPGEWLHTFTWHGSDGGSEGVHKIAKGLVFQKLWLMPDQMYHDVSDVRTADDAVLTIRLMLFFELLDIERMLETTHDPIGDFINAATSDVVDFTGRHSFESFKQNTGKLNDLDTYKQLVNRAEQCGYRINKVVYRGYGAPERLQAMHDQAIEARTKLQLERATEQQAQELEDDKLTAQITRAAKRRTEQATEVRAELELSRQRQEAELRQREASHSSAREQRRADTAAELEMQAHAEVQRREHLAILAQMGVDLTAYLTQARADRVIELRGPTVGTHLHLDRTDLQTDRE